MEKHHKKPSAPTASPPGVVVVVPHWNRIDQTTACCRALEQLAYPLVTVLVVDNGSTEHSPEALDDACPGAKILRLPRNRGFAGAVNAGIREALRSPAIAYVWLLNNDTTCSPDALDRLVAIARSDPQIGLLASPMLEGSEPGGVRRISAGKRLRAPLYAPGDIPRDTVPDYLSGANLLIRRAVFEDIGLFDEGFFFFFEDADFSRRARQAGWRLAEASDTLVRHLGSATIGALSELQALHYRAGHVRFLRKHAAHPRVSAGLCMGWCLLNDTLHGRRAAVRGNLQGWQKGWRDTVAKAEFET